MRDELDEKLARFETLERDLADPVIQGDERIRSQLAILANFLGRWMTRDYCAMMRELIST
ncbi:hypothetical protein EBU58_12950 [bacterium]|nr:hypothetical protein [bacterium]